MQEFYLLNPDMTYRSVSMKEWAASPQQNIATTQLIQSQANVLGKGVLISTVFLHVHHFGGQFETMVFMDDEDDRQQRHLTYEEAVHFHTRVEDELSAMVNTRITRTITYNPTQPQ